MNRTLLERAKCMSLNTDLRKVFWVEVVNMFCYIINRSPHTALVGKTLEKVWAGKLIYYSGLKIFSCPYNIHI